MVKVMYGQVHRDFVHEVSRTFEEPNTIELLGYAKNEILEVKTKESSAPGGVIQILGLVYTLLDSVQKYLYFD